jgi:hypothetical protein
VTGEVALRTIPERVRRTPKPTRRSAADDEEQEKANMTHLRETLERRIAAGDRLRGDR